MSDNTLTIALEGDISLKQFAKLTHSFTNLIDKLSEEVAAEYEIEWLIDDLQAGSASATVVGISQEDEPILRVINAYETVGRSLQRYEPIPYSKAVAHEAIQITQVISKKITAVRFETAKSESIIYGAFAPDVSYSQVSYVSFSSLDFCSSKKAAKGT